MYTHIPRESILDSAVAEPHLSTDALKVYVPKKSSLSRDVRVNGNVSLMKLPSLKTSLTMGLDPLNITQLIITNDAMVDGSVISCPHVNDTNAGFITGKVDGGTKVGTSV